MARLDSLVEQLRVELGGELVSAAILRKQYPRRDFTCGVTKSLQFDDGVCRNLDILIGTAAPFVAPTAAIRDASRFMQWPHVERDGVVCTPSAGQPCSEEAFIQAGLDVAQEALVNAQRSIVGDNSADFIDEIDAYWSQASNASGGLVVSSLTIGGNSRAVAIAKLGRRTLLADDEESLKSLAERFSTGASQSLIVEIGYLVNLDGPLLPSEFPENGRALSNLVKQSDDAVFQQSSSTVNSRYSPRYVLQVPTGDGWFIGLARSHWNGGRPVHRRGHGACRAAIPGFRDGRALGVASLHTILSPAAPVTRDRVERIDAAVALSRAGMAPAAVATRTVAIIGCGSLGSSILDLLAKSGIERFVLADPDVMSSGNLSRHLLGLHEVGMAKACAAADHVANQRPWVERVDSINRRVEEFSDADWLKVLDADVIVSAIGHSGVENHFAHVARAKGYSGLIVYCWLEPFAIGGHALICVPGHDHLIDVLGADGSMTPEVSTWARTTQLETTVGGCGGSFQPYGAVALETHAAVMTKSIIAALAKCPLKSTYVLSSGTEGELRQACGAWSEWWYFVTHGNCADRVMRWTTPELVALRTRGGT